MNDKDFARFIDALQFAAHKHRLQKRKGEDGTPYINHLIDVAGTLVRAEVTDADTLTAALLHDVVEDQEVLSSEIATRFGDRVAAIVAEVTDDKSREKSERKQLQVQHAPHLSDAAKQLKIADKICNILDVAYSPALGWSPERRMGYLQWSADVVNGCRSINPRLDAMFDETLAECRAILQRGPYLP